MKASDSSIVKGVVVDVEKVQVRGDRGRGRERRLDYIPIYKIMDNIK